MEQRASPSRGGASGLVITIASVASLYVAFRLFGAAISMPMNGWLEAMVWPALIVALASMACAALQPSRWRWAAVYCGVPAIMVQLFIYSAFMPRPLPDDYLQVASLSVGLSIAAAFVGAMAGRLLRLLDSRADA